MYQWNLQIMTSSLYKRSSNLIGGRLPRHHISNGRLKLSFIFSIAESNREPYICYLSIYFQDGYLKKNGKQKGTNVNSGI